MLKSPDTKKTDHAKKSGIGILPSIQIYIDNRQKLNAIDFDLSLILLWYLRLPNFLVLRWL